MASASVTRDGDVVRIAGPATMETVPALVAAGQAHLAAGAGRVSFAQVTEVDSSAVAMLLDWVRAARDAGRGVAVEDVPPALANLARLYAVTGLLGLPGR